MSLKGRRIIAERRQREQHKRALAKQHEQLEHEQHEPTSSLAIFSAVPWSALFSDTDLDGGHDD